MGEVAVTIIKWGIRISIVVLLILAFVIFYNYIYSLISVTLDGGVVTDLMALVQIWLPFNLNILFGWILTASVLYITYKTALFALGIVNKFVGES